jgi:hypothetical protein
MQKYVSDKTKSAEEMRKMLERRNFLKSEVHKDALKAAGRALQKVRREIELKQSSV